jgi:hypothetical protein
VLNLKSEWGSDDIVNERGHWLSIIRLDNSTEKGNGSRGALFGEESENSQHSSTSVIDLGAKTTLLGLLRHVLGELEGIVKVEWNRVGDSLRTTYKVGEVTWLSSGHVMLVARSGELGPEFKEGDNSEDLPLSRVRDGVPKSRWVGLSWERGSIHLHGPWELNSIGMNNVSNKGEHSNTGVLDLGMTEESNGGFIGGSPELGFGKVEGIVESNDRVELLGKDLKISLEK